MFNNDGHCCQCGEEVGLKAINGKMYCKKCESAKMKIKVITKKVTHQELKGKLSVFGFASIQPKPIGKPVTDGGEWEIIVHGSPRSKEQITDLLKGCVDVESIYIDGVQV